MNASPLRNAVALVMALSAAWPCSVRGQDAAPGPLEEFGSLMVGVWEGDGTRQAFEWGVGRKAIKSQSFWVEGEAWGLVSEGLWWWDEQAHAVRGIVLAVDMPVERFEYTARVDGQRVVHDLRAFGAMGGEFVETWVVERGGYEWSLEQVGPDGARTRLMGGRLSKVGGQEPPG